MPFGSTCAFSVFQRLMDLELSGLSRWSGLVYLDDVIVFERYFDEAMDRLKKVFGPLQKTRLKPKSKFL